VVQLRDVLETDSRQRFLGRLRRETFDVLILGGGVNGAGLARDLALRAHAARVPLAVALVEQNHFASGTSGRNSQLIHGGLRYLKYMQFGLVREALRERATLLRLAPHLVSPLPFLIPMYSRFDRWFYGAGLRLYDWLAGAHRVGPQRRLTPGEVVALEPGLALEGLAGGAVFYDCKVNSARFVLENVIDAASHGAVAVNYTRAVARSRAGGVWNVELEDRLSAGRFCCRAKALVDTTGAWSDAGSLRLVRGSHLILPRLGVGDHAIAFFEPAGRIVFLIPWGEDRQVTLVGTTDIDHHAGPDQVRISREEVGYLLGIVRGLFPAARNLKPLAAFSSLRALAGGESESATAASREHRIWRSDDGIVRVAGGKFTTYRIMAGQAAELVLSEVAPELGGLRVTATTPLASGDWRGMPEAQRIERAVRREMALRLADLLFVSTCWGYERAWTAPELAPYAATMGALLGWDNEKTRSEIGDVLNRLSIPEPAE
jgi:glycerol-3-phosphate dehydrogenase